VSARKARPARLGLGVRREELIRKKMIRAITAMAPPPNSISSASPGLPAAFAGGPLRHFRQIPRGRNSRLFTAARSATFRSGHGVVFAMNVPDQIEEAA